jgi:hypothetical protein
LPSIVTQFRSMTCLQKSRPMLKVVHAAKGQCNTIASGQAYAPRITDCSQQYLLDLTKRSQEKP